ncbi:MAG: hypothetical protein JXA37_07850 [Chloroflexia bacterium]|nr:hypothetical protein [Chloroflexia bacterium]
MNPSTIIEYFPLQIMSHEQLEELVQQAREETKRSRFGQGKLKKEDQPICDIWEGLAEHVAQAVLDTHLYGEGAPKNWRQIVESELGSMETTYSDEICRQVRALYKNYLDALYGILQRHTLRNIPTGLYSTQGYLVLRGVRFFRYTMLRDTPEKSSLAQLLEIMYKGGFRFELEFDFKPLTGEWRPRDR